MTEEIMTTGEKFYCLIQDIEEYIQHNSLEQDEELDFILRQSEKLQSDYGRLEQENKELKEEIQFHKKENSNLLAERNASQIGYDEIREVKERYRSALEEIRTYLNTLSSIDNDFPNTETYLRIQTKITEVLGQTVDVGFWDKDGNYQEDIQEISKEELQ